MPSTRVRCSGERRVRCGIRGLRGDGGGPFIKRLPFAAILKQDCESRFLWKFGITRSDAQTFMERIAAAGAAFQSLTENIDTTSPAGRMMMQMVASFAEFERAMIRERTSAGLAAARAEGRVGGRRKKLDAAKRREIAESVISGRKTGAEMARLYNVSAPTVSRTVSAHRTGLADINHAVR